MLLSMESNRRKVWTEQDEIDAARLLAVLEQRSKKKRLAGGLVGEPAKIRDPAPTVLEKRPAGESKMGLGLLDHRPRQFTPQPGEASGDHVTEGENGHGLDADGVGSGPVEPGDVLEHPSATQRRFVPKRFHDNGSGVRREAGNVRWEKK
ncbi:MAG: hypothetical protein E5X86_19730 [Mesorhizobium sp.]|uniref:hypothetical protein n=1 Tax=Mesorhizobium sp. TaxID=1871066 RepID=UPI00120AE117|nr:hypothetical protein [Mesorhizobium sp.]TIO15604.1 MAG: hypothetical protein E5X86_19730 [Mesorhizobium sp.]